MDKVYIYIIGLFLFTFSCGSNKIVTDSNITSSDYPYINAFHEAIRLKIAGRNLESIKKLEYCLSIRKDDAAVYYLLSQLEYTTEGKWKGRGNIDKSVDYIIKASDIDPDNQWYIEELAFIYYEIEEFEKSAEKFDDLVKLRPRNIELQYTYAEVLLKIGEYNKAIDVLNRVEDQVGISLPVSIKKHNILMEMKNYKKAILELDNARDFFSNNPQLIGLYVDYYFKLNEVDKGVKMLKELVLADPNNGRAHLTLSDIYRKEGNNEESFKELILAFKCKDVTLDTKMKILINILETNFNIEPQYYNLIDILVDLYPKEAKVYSIKGDYLIRAKKNDEALEVYRKSLSYDKTRYPIWNEVLIMEYQKGEFKNLYQHSKECLTFFPTLPTVYLLNGISANKLKKYNEALELLSYGKALVVNDNQLEADFFSQLGEAYFGLKDFVNGKKSFQKALILDSKNTFIRNNFAFQLAINREDLELAESLAIQINKSVSSNPKFIYTYGLILFQKGDYDAALIQLQKAIKLKENDKNILERLGDVYFKLGQINKSIDLWQKAKKLNSGNKILLKKIEDKKYYDPVF